MASPAENAAPVADASPVSTVGYRLRQARESANLTTSEVAQSLKFSARQVELLESDNYASLPGNTIVRGFVRSYARLLKLDEATLLRLLDERSPKQVTDVRPPDNMGVAETPGGSRQIPAILAVAIVLGLSALLLGLWHFFGPASPRSTASAPVVATVPQTAPLADTATPSPAVVPAPANAEAALVQPATPTPAGEPALLFVFEGRSWLEVMDGSRQVIHSAENPAGSQLRLSGKPPYDIVIGNATKVKLSYGEREVDLVPYTRADVARLKLE